MDLYCRFIENQKAAIKLAATKISNIYIYVNLNIYISYVQSN